MIRTLALWFADWPVIAAGLVDGVSVHSPVAVMHANRVVACSAAARREGVRRGLRKREAHGRCPHLVMVDHDPGRDTRAFEPVVAAIEELAPGVEILRPGVCVLAARGPASYFGSETAAAERLIEHAALSCWVEAQVGIADGTFAAVLAARAGQIVPPGQTAAFLAGMDISALDRPDLTDLLRRLGVRTLADFAALPATDVVARFGLAAGQAHRLAAGADQRLLAPRTPPPDLAVAGHYEPPLERVDMAAFAARALAEQLHEKLAGHGLAAARLGIEARTAAGEELHRAWRHDGLLDAGAIADRVRWQLEGWLTGVGAGSARAGGPPARPTAGIDYLRLIPDGVVRYAGMQAGLWGETGVADERAHRALVRVQTLLGPESVHTAVIGGGRDYTERVRLVPWGDERVPARPDGPPWPGRLPAPAPATVLDDPVPIDVCASDGTIVSIDAWSEMTGPPARVRIGRKPAIDVTGWAGPWPVDERWWAPGEEIRLTRLQLCLVDGSALLVALRDGQWRMEASYD